MVKSVSKEVKRGQAISFRVPSDTPDHLLKQLQKLKETERRNFSSKIAEFVMRGVGESLSKEKEMISIPLPHQLTKQQRNWLKHEHSEALLGSIVYQLLTDPVRAASLLASLNSNSLNIDDALYLQEDTVDDEVIEHMSLEKRHSTALNEVAFTDESTKFEDDLNAFNLEDLNEGHSTEKEEDKDEETTNDDLSSLLGDFLAEMNK